MKWLWCRRCRCYWAVELNRCFACGESDQLICILPWAIEAATTGDPWPLAEFLLGPKP